MWSKPVFEHLNWASKAGVIKLELSRTEFLMKFGAIFVSDVIKMLWYHFMNNCENNGRIPRVELDWQMINIRCKIVCQAIDLHAIDRFMQNYLRTMLIYPQQQQQHQTDSVSASAVSSDTIIMNCVICGPIPIFLWKTIDCFVLELALHRM